jgi:hypothetical protein
MWGHGTKPEYFIKFSICFLFICLCFCSQDHAKLLIYQDRLL